jgi:hypothetical protein
MCGLRHATIEAAVFSMWPVHATVAEACFLCVGSVLSGYKRGEFRSGECSAVSRRWDNEGRRLDEYNSKLEV